MSNRVPPNRFCVVALLACMLAAELHAQMSPAFRTIANFPTEAQSTESWLVMDKSGAIFGTTGSEGAFGNGAIFQLTPPQMPGDEWTPNFFYSFRGGPDGSNPDSGVFFGPDGNLYGTTMFGGTSGRGVLFQLQPPKTPEESWKETVIHSFSGVGDDGSDPGGSLVIGDGGEIYGSTSYGGGSNEGTIYRLTPPVTSFGSWTKTTLFTFPDRSGAIRPSGLVKSGHRTLYGTAFSGGTHGVGTVFELDPRSAEGDAPVEATLHSFDSKTDGSYPEYGVAVGANGVLYGLTFSGASGFGTLYALHPPEGMGGEWTSAVLHSFTGGSDGGAPISVPLIGNDGRIYGTTAAGGDATGLAGDGVLFVFSGKEGVETVLHWFHGKDGSAPEDNLCQGPDGAIYGISTLGGANDGGTVFQFQ